MIDSHQHFWHYNPIRDTWMDAPIQKDFLPSDLKPIYDKNGITGCIAVQADQSEEETLFLLDLADKNYFIKGVVGWVDLKDKDLEKRLVFFKRYPKLKGFRHILQGEKPGYMLDKPFINGVSLLKKYDFTYDILVFPRHLKAVKKFVKYFPNQPFIIDHIAKPYIKKGLIKEWAADMKSLAKYDNIYCKISGMVTEANWSSWTAGDFKPYLDAVFEAFSTNRVCYGSDWPVCLLAATYEQQLAIIKNYIEMLSPNEQKLILGENALRFYG